MRVGVVGGGLAGALLAWRLAGATPRCEVEVVLGHRCLADASHASGGAVRAYEADPHLRRLAAASLVELLGSPTLQRWAAFRPVESIYLHPAGTSVDTSDLHSVDLLSGRELAGRGWAGVPGDAVAVHERRAGYLVPGRLREAVLADAAARRRVRLLPAPLAALRLPEAGPVRCTVAGATREYDLVVVAAGPWTGAVLTRAGFPAGALRTKSIQYTVYRTGDWRPPQFVDELAGLFGRPTAEGGLLLGVPTDRWGVDPDRPPVSAALVERAARLARARFPALRLGPITRTVGAADCYGAQPTLSLRPVVDSDHRLFTFTGGAGGSVKTALAASRDAVTQLVDPGTTPHPPPRPAPLPLGPSRGTP